MTSETALYRALVRDAMRADCAEVATGATCQETVARLRTGDATSVVVVDEAHRPVGIVTEQDVARRITFVVAGDAPIADIMTAPVKTISGDEFLFHAIAMMRRFNIRHVPVIDNGDDLVGILRLKDALFETDKRLMVEIDTLVAAGGIEGFAGVKAALAGMAGRLLEDGVPVPEIQALLTEVNNDLYRRIAELTLDEMVGAGRGAPPVDFSIIVMGSGGRGENFIHPDQDNGLIL
ncbi:MAG: CBS domain-containing protein, partial [Alphaproteobacteria bacterium]|nr:CBS domain-containing protein [Alphaproteobacteria bacterium]